MNTERLRLWAACRPVLGLIIRGRPVLFPPTYYYLVRHPRFVLYLRRPYDESNDPRRVWGRLEHAYRFATATVAHDQSIVHGGTVERCELNRY